jgi:hypothetical protein
VAPRQGAAFTVDGEPLGFEPLIQVSRQATIRESSPIA